jgi:hypothetical protein
MSKRHMVGSLKMNTTLEYSTRVVQEGDRRCKKSTLSDVAYLTPLRIPVMNPVIHTSESMDLDCIIILQYGSRCVQSWNF